jgi:electron transfer flavoprotein beta subunit
LEHSNNSQFSAEALEWLWVQMRILVLVKQTPDAEASISIAKDGMSLVVRESDWRMNGFDEFAVEEALRIREALPGSAVEAVSVGPARVAAVLRRALAMGADEGIHVLYEEHSEAFPGAVASLLAAFARDRSYDLILAGVMSDDAMHAQTGPMVAELLDIPCATAVVAERLSPDSGRISVERELEGGLREGLEMPLPALITVQSGINRPRYPVLSHVLRSRLQPLLTVRADELPKPLQSETLLGIDWPVRSAKVLFLEGTPAKKAERLAGIFHKMSFL